MTSWYTSSIMEQLCHLSWNFNCSLLSSQLNVLQGMRRRAESSAAGQASHPSHPAAPSDWSSPASLHVPVAATTQTYTPPPPLPAAAAAAATAAYRRHRRRRCCCRRRCHRHRSCCRHRRRSRPRRTAPHRARPRQIDVRSKNSSRIHRWPRKALPSRPDSWSTLPNHAHTAAAHPPNAFLCHRPPPTRARLRTHSTPSRRTTARTSCAPD